MPLNILQGTRLPRQHRITWPKCQHLVSKGLRSILLTLLRNLFIRFFPVTMPPCNFTTTDLLYMFTSYMHICALFFKKFKFFAQEPAFTISPQRMHDLDLCSLDSFPLE